MTSEEVGIRQLLQSPDTSATVIHGIMLNKYGKESYNWDLTTVLYELNDDYHVDISTAGLNRWAAIQTLMLSDAFFNRLDAFLAICNTLTVGEPYFTVLDPATIEEAAWGISEVSLNRDIVPFDESIRKYVRAVLKGDYTDDAIPPVFDAVLNPGKHTGVRELLSSIRRTSENQHALDAYIDEQLTDMAFQMNKVPSLADTVNKLARHPGDTIVDML